MIHVAKPDFDFSKVALSAPVATTSGAYFTRTTYVEDDVPEESLYIYTPKCVARTGITADGNKRFIDLTFTNANAPMLEWASALEEHFQQHIFSKRKEWFTDTELGLDDIQSVFIPLMKPSKGGQFVLRAYISQGRSKFPTLPPVFDTNETPLSIEDVHPEASLIAILDIQGIKFTSRSFSVVAAVKQIMLLQDTTKFSQCLIRPDVPAKPAPQAAPAPEPPAAGESPSEDEDTSDDEDVALEFEEIVPVETAKKKEALQKAQWYEARASEALRKAKELKDALN